MKKLAVIQSNYIPWKGYFDIINDADLFIFHDDVQYTKNDWRNRNKIKTDKGTKWITIPVGTKDNRLICDVEIKDHNWLLKHWNMIKQYYSKATHFKTIKPFIQYIYQDKKWSNLSSLNQFIIKFISKEYLKINTEFKDSRDFKPEGKKLDRLINLIKKTKAGSYISGPAAKNYINEDRFKEEGIQLIYKDYSGYPEYPQFYPPFEHAVSIIDLLFHTGPDAPYYIWGWREGRGK